MRKTTFSLLALLGLTATPAFAESGDAQVGKVALDGGDLAVAGAGERLAVAEAQVEIGLGGEDEARGREDVGLVNLCRAVAAGIEVEPGGFQPGAGDDAEPREQADVREEISGVDIEGRSVGVGESVGDIAGEGVIGADAADRCGDVLKVGRVVEVAVGAIGIESAGKIVGEILLAEITRVAAAEPAGLQSPPEQPRPGDPYGPPVYSPARTGAHVERRTSCP